MSPPEQCFINSRINTDVLIGGGPVGLTLALYLARRGIEVTVAETQFESRMEGIAFGVLERIVARRENRQNSREDKNKLIRLTVAVALACAILLSSIPASAKWLLLVQFGTTLNWSGSGHHLTFTAMPTSASTQY